MLHPTHLWLTIHESVGHPTELDRSLWWEANYAGTSFLTPDKTGKLQFASKIMNFVADRTQPAGLATVGYDDEGVPGQKLAFDQRRNVCRLANDPRPGGSDGTEEVVRLSITADSWGSISFPRMPNVSLEPGSA